MKQYAALDDTVYFWFAANDTSGSGGDGASPAADVRLAGAATDAAPVYSPTPALLSHASYPAGAYEIAIAATAANGFAVNNTYAIFCTLAIDAQNPTGFVGSFDLKPVEANVTQLLDTAWITPGVAGTPDVNAKLLGGTAQTGNDIGADVNSILEDTGTTLDTLIKDIPTVAEFEARSILAADYVVVGDTIAGVTAVTNDVGITQAGADKVWGTAVRALTDKAGFTLSAAGITAIWEKNISAFAGAGYAGTYVKTLYDDWINAGRLDAILDIIAADVVNIDGDAMRGTDSANTTTPPTVNAIADQVWDEILTGATHNIATSAGRRLREIAGFAVHSGTARAGTITTITLEAGADGGDGIYNRNLIVIISGTGAGQTRTITDYDDTTKVCAIDREWHINPDDTSEYQILADDTPLTVDHGIARGGTSTTITLRTAASSDDEIYLCNIVAILGGRGRGQARLVGSYNGTTKVVTICGDDWVTSPDDTSIYAMIPYGTTCTNCVGDYALAQIADAAWDELQSGHTDAGSFGKYLDAAISGIGGEVGSGALSCTWTQKDEGETTMDNVQVWISTDEAGNNVVAGTLITNASGEATFMLDAGTYYVWRERAGYNFTNPQTWTVS